MLVSGASTENVLVQTPAREPNTGLRRGGRRSGGRGRRRVQPKRLAGHSQRGLRKPDFNYATPSRAGVTTRRVDRFCCESPQAVFPNPANVPQKDVNDWLNQVRTRKNLSTALRLLFETNKHTGHIRNWDSALTHFSYKQRNIPFLLQAFINHLRSQYSRNYARPMEGVAAPRSAKCKICPQHIADERNPLNARMRAMYFTLRGNRYYIHPSQYPYGNGHLILIQLEHRHMHHDYDSLMDHITLLDQAPEYAVCQNSHIVGAGATLPQHHHVPIMMKHELPIMNARIRDDSRGSAAGVDFALLDYPFTTFSLSSCDGEKLAIAAEAIIDDWKASEHQDGTGAVPNAGASDKDKPETRTANYILYKDGDEYRILIFLRDVSCMPGPEFKQVKSEYCGFIELAGKLLLADRAEPEEDRLMKTRLADKRWMTRVIDQGLRELDPLQKPEARQPAELVEKAKLKLQALSAPE